MTRSFIGTLLMGFFSLGIWGQTRIISHVTAPNGGFLTTVIVENNAAGRQAVTLSAYDTDGRALTPVEVSLEGGAVLSQTAPDLFQTSVSHFVVQGSPEMNVSVNYDFQAGNSSPALVAETDQQASIWRIFAGNWATIFDGIAFVNTGDESTDVWLAQKDYDGNVIRTRQIATALAPNAKALYVIGSPNGSEFVQDTGYFEVSGDQLLAVTALRGTLSNGTLNLLWANEARTRGSATSKRDDRGVWFIEDGSLYDVMEMMGYNVAVDRLFQMDLLRRSAVGTLSELIGPNAVETDIILRKLAYSNDELDALFNGLDADSQTMIKAYVEGVNRRTGQVNDTVNRPGVTSLVPVEYQAVQETRVAPWTHRDLMAHLGRFQLGFSMRSTGSEQIVNGIILQNLQDKFGPEQGAMMFNDVRYVNDPQIQTMIETEPSNKGPITKQSMPLPILDPNLPDIRQDAMEFVTRLDRIETRLKEAGIHIKGGSYAWAVHGSKTASGNPILYSGPQVGFAAPSLMVEGSVKSDALTVSGMLIPGIPAIVLGRTPHHAWGMQIGHASSWDYYLEDPEDISVIRTETIKVKGAADVRVDIQYSSHGPILTSLADKGLAFKYSNRDREFDLGPGFLGMARAQSLEAFGEAVEHIGVTQHVTYVDTGGNIAYWHSGREPIRVPGDYRIPQGMLANQDVLEWDADVALPLFHEANPTKGWIAGWNNKPHPDKIDYAGTAGFGPFHRGHVIKDFFDAYDPSAPWTFEQLSDFAIDIAATNNWGGGGNAWTRLGPAVVQAVAANSTPERDAAIALFDDWDGHAIAGGPTQWVHGTDIQDASVLLDALIPRLIAQAFDDEMGPSANMFDSVIRFHILQHGLYEGGLDNSYDWFTNLADSSAPQTAEGVILAALDSTLQALGPRPWGQGARINLTYPHPVFGDIVALPIVNQTPTLFMHRSTYAHTVEYGSEGPIQIQSIFSLGQSGTILGTLFAPLIDENAFSMKEDFDNFVLRPFPLFD